MAGYLFFIPVVYFWRMRAEKTDQSFYGNNNNRHVISKPYLMKGFLIFALRAIVQLTANFMTRDTLPKLLYGTKDLDVMPDFLVKRLLFALFYGTFPVIPLEQLVRL